MRKTSAIVLFVLSSFSLTANAVEFTLFGDVVFMDTDAESDSNTFNLGGFNLIANQEIGKDTTVNAEVVFEDAGHGFEVDVERFAVTRHFSPMLNFGMGRFHTHLGIWNQNFHHGTLIQDTITRPFFLEFEDAHGGIFPNHLIGLVLNGESDKWGYQFGYGNSNGINTVGSDSHSEETALEVINNSDPSDEKSVVIRFNYQPNSFLDEIGVFFMHNHVVEVGEGEGTELPFVDRGEVLFEQKILGFDLRYTGEKFYSFFELFHTSIDDNQDIVDPSLTPEIFPNPSSYDSLAYYFQLGYHATENMSLIGRYESLDYDNGATYFNYLHTLPENRYVFAVNYKIQESNAVRFEFSRADIEDEDSETSLAVQWFFILL